MQSVFRHLSLPQRSRLVLGADLNRSESSRLLISHGFLPESVTTKRSRDALRHKRFFPTSVTTTAAPRASRSVCRCTLDDQEFFERDYYRTRCLNCARPLRLRLDYHSSRVPSLNAQTCCEDCRRLARNKRNAERRRGDRAIILAVRELRGEFLVGRLVVAQHGHRACVRITWLDSSLDWLPQSPSSLPAQ